MYQSEKPVKIFLVCSHAADMSSDWCQARENHRPPVHIRSYSDAEINKILLLFRRLNDDKPQRRLIFPLLQAHVSLDIVKHIRVSHYTTPLEE